MDFVSDWAILNDTKSKQLGRILAEFHHLRDSEIRLACVLLESYHSVYRRDRLEQRRNQLKAAQTRMEAPCPPPTPAQLQEIARRVNAKTALNIGAEEAIAQLQDLAKRLRQYRLYIRAGLRGTSFLNKNNCQRRDLIQLKRSTENGHIPFVQLFPV